MESQYFLRGIESRYESLSTCSVTFDATVSCIFHYSAGFVMITNREKRCSAGEKKRNLENEEDDKIVREALIRGVNYNI